MCSSDSENHAKSAVAYLLRLSSVPMRGVVEGRWSASKCAAYAASVTEPQDSLSTIAVNLVRFLGTLSSYSELFLTLMNWGSCRGLEGQMAWYFSGIYGVNGFDRKRTLRVTVAQRNLWVDIEVLIIYKVTSIGKKKDFLFEGICCFEAGIR